MLPGILHRGEYQKIHGTGENGTVILLAVLVQAVPTHGHKDGLLKVRLALTAVANGQLGGGGAVQAVQQLRVGQVSAPFENVDFRQNGVSFLTGQHTGVIQP